MTSLPDVNVWIALAIDIHEHHSVARRWIEGKGSGELAFCRITEMGLLRLLTNPRVMDDAPLTASQACNIRDRLLDDPRVKSLGEPEGFEEKWRQTSRAGKVGPNFWTGAYLISLCASANCTLVTFDRLAAGKGGSRVHLLAGG
jgi:toxin-antitoxin system PIN domain toxin